MRERDHHQRDREYARDDLTDDSSTDDEWIEVKSRRHRHSTEVEVILLLGVNGAKNSVY